MMIEEKIPEKEWMVLEHFIFSESKKIESILKRHNKATPENSDHFSTYPGEIESSIDTSRVTAGKACKRLLKMSILEIPKITYTHLKGGKSNFYSLRSDLPTIKTLVKLILEELSFSKAKNLLDNYYFTYNLNEALVREVLCEKNVSITRHFSLIDIDSAKMKNLVKTYNSNNPGEEAYLEDKENVDSQYRDIISKYEKNNKKNESEYIQYLKQFCDQFEADIKDQSFDAKQYYFRDHDLYNISRSKFLEHRNTRNHFSYSNSIGPIVPLTLTFPVLKSDFYDRNNLDKIKEVNFDTFYYACYGDPYETYMKYPSWIIKEIISINQFLYESMDKVYYDSEKYKSLHELSTKITEFIDQIDTKFNRCCAHLNFSEIKNDIIDLQNQTVECFNSIKNKDIEDVIDEQLIIINMKFGYIIRLLDKTKNIKNLSDQYIENNYASLFEEHYSVFEYEKLILPILALIHTSPRALNEFLNGDWKPFNLMFHNQRDTDNSEFLTKLMQITLVDAMCTSTIFKKGIVNAFSFNSSVVNGFDMFSRTAKQNDIDFVEYKINIRGEYYGELSYKQLRKDEYKPLSIQMKQIYEFYLSMYYSTNANDDQKKISSSLSLNLIPDVEFQFFTVHNLKDAISLIKKLSDTRNSLYSHIRSLLSTKMQNIVLYYDVSSEPSIKLKEELLDELSHVMLKPELYKKGIFDKLVQSDEKVKDAVEYISKSNVSFKDMIQSVHENSGSSLARQILISNQQILRKIFKDEFDYDERYY